MRDDDDGDVFDGDGGGPGDDDPSGGDSAPRSPALDDSTAAGSPVAVTTSPLIGVEGKRYLYDRLSSADLQPTMFVAAFQAAHSLPAWTRPALDLITASGLSQAEAHQMVVTYMVDKLVTAIAVSAGGGGGGGHHAHGGGTLSLPPVTHEAMVALLVASFPYLSTPLLAPVPTALLVHLPDPPDELLLELAASAPAKPPYVGLPLDVKRKVWDAQGAWSAAFDADAAAAIDALRAADSYGGRRPDGRVQSIFDATGPDDWTPPQPEPTAHLRAAVGDSADRYGQLADALVERYAEASAAPAARRGGGAVADDAELPDAAVGRVIAAGGVAAATVLLYALGRWRAGDVVGFFRLRAAVSDAFVAAGGAVGWLGSTADVLLDVLDEWDHDVVD